MHRHQDCYSRTYLMEQNSQDKISEIGDHEGIKLPKYENCGETNKDHENKKKSHCIICGKEMGNEGRLCSKRCLEIYYNFHKSLSMSISGFCNFCGKPITLVKDGHKVEKNNA